MTYPSQAETAFFTGTQRMAAGDGAGAETCFRQALALAPHMAEALANLALLREQAGDLAEAEEIYQRALALHPGNAQVYLNFGVFLMHRKSFAAAEAVYRTALALEPDSPPAWSNLGVLLACVKREDEAERCYRRALELDGGYAKAQFNLAYVLLRQGRFEEGWPCLEARDWYPMLAAHFTCPRWQGEALTGKSIVIGVEAGHGDMIQFCRYAIVLKARGATRITLLCHPGLKTLFATLAGVDEVLSVQDDIPRSGWDFWTPPMSLPGYCQTRLDTIPAAVPYLSADPLQAARWSQLLPESGARVGLVWKGNPAFENDRERSLPALELLAPLGAVSGVQFISLQKGAGEAEALHPPAQLPLLPLGATLTDFADTAALLANLDLLICVDTAVAHLAGALGKPCWLLLPDYKTDWRWLTERSDTPWYPHMRLFRQSPGGGWPEVIGEVARALQHWVSTRQTQ